MGKVTENHDRKREMLEEGAQEESKNCTVVMGCGAWVVQKVKSRL